MKTMRALQNIIAIMIEMMMTPKKDNRGARECYFVFGRVEYAVDFWFDISHQSVHFFRADISYLRCYSGESFGAIEKRLFNSFVCAIVVTNKLSDKCLLLARYERVVGGIAHVKSLAQVFACVDDRE
jgi:hypothetical protein